MAATDKATSAVSAPPPPNRSTSDRRRFALTCPSTALDHRQNAARRDLAEIDLAGRWFAPHYAVPQLKSCGMAGADIRSSASMAAPRISQLLPGERFAVVESSGTWAWGYSDHDRYVGYVPSAALTHAPEPTHIVVAPSALAFASASARADVQAVLPMGSLLSGTAQDDFLATDHGFVPLGLLRPAGAYEGDPAAVAERMIGTPYLWGGRGIGGIDCSGLVQLAFALTGRALPRDSDQQADKGSEATGAPRRGDLHFFADHVVLLTAPDRAIHASGHAMAVTAEPLADIVARLGNPIARRRILP